MKNNKTITFLCLLLSSQFYFCQDDWTTFPAEQNIDSNIVYIYNEDSIIKLLEYNDKHGNIYITKSGKIDSLINNLDQENTIIGYTIQIEVSQQTKLIQEARIKFIKKYPKEQIFDEYIAPNTYLYVGNFYDKNDAYAFKNEISKLFSNTIVIRKQMELPLIGNLKK